MDIFINLINAIIGLLSQISPTFWGVLIGSFFSLGGVVLTNRANDKRLIQQLSNDRELKTRERELSLRKEVFMDAADAVSTGINAVGKFANLDVPDDKLTSSFLEKSSAIAKVYVISQTGTVKAVDSMIRELNAIYMRLMAKRIPLMAHKQRIEIMQKQIKGFEQERDRMLEMMKQYNISGESDSRKWSMIGQNYTFEATRIDETIKEQSKCAIQLTSDQIAFMRDCIEETKKLNRLLIPVIKAVRNELEMPFDEIGYASVIEENILKQEQSVEEFIEKVRLSVINQLSVVDEQTSSSS